MKLRHRQPTRWGLVLLMAFWMLVVLPIYAAAAPYAGFVMDARNGKVLYESNADARLHPASLTKMMTLYIAFEAIKHGEISLDTKVKVSKHAASEPPSKLGLRTGQRIALRYLIRAAAVKSANDAATAIAEAISGSVPAFAARMNRTAKAMGMNRTTFKNANGLTQAGHLSTARDMSVLGRHLFYDYPEYYNLFSRITVDAGVKRVRHTNRRLLQSYRGADGIKTGYTRAAGFNLVASAHRGQERIIATVFGGKSTASRNAQVAKLLDLGFRKSPSRVAVRRPKRPPYYGPSPGRKVPETPDVTDAIIASVKNTKAVVVKPKRETVQVSLRPKKRVQPEKAPAPVVEVAKADIESALVEAVTAQAAATPPVVTSGETPKPEAKPVEAETPAEVALADTAPKLRPQALVQTPEPTAKPVDQAAIEDAAKQALAENVAPDEAEKDVAKTEVAEADSAEPESQEAIEVASASSLKPRVRPQDLAVQAAEEPKPAEAVAVASNQPAQAPRAKVVQAKAQKQELITRATSSGGRHWGINIGRYPSQAKAQRVLLKTALSESSTLDGSLRKVVKRSNGFDANFMGLSREMADLACRRLQARQVSCFTIGPG